MYNCTLVISEDLRVPISMESSVRLSHLGHVRNEPVIFRYRSGQAFNLFSQFVHGLGSSGPLLAHC